MDHKPGTKILNMKTKEKNMLWMSTTATYLTSVFN